MRRIALGNKQQFSRLVCFLCAIAIPLILVYSWHNLNVAYPRADCESYYETAQDIYLEFQTKGFFEGLNAAYLKRGARPIFFSLAIVPFIFINNGDILSSSAMTLFFLFFILLTYIYLISRAFLSPPLAIISTISVGTLHWLLYFSFELWSEILLMLCSAALFYHLIKSRFFTSLKHSLFLGFWLGMGLLVRPFEFILAYIIIFIFYIWIALKNKRIKIKDLTSTAFIISLLVIYLGLIIYSNTVHTFAYINNSYSMLIFFSLLGFLFYKLPFTNKAYKFTLVICSIMVVLWWRIGIKVLFDWAFNMTGISAKFYADQTYAAKGGMTIFEGFSFFLSKVGNVPLLIKSSLLVSCLLLTLFLKRNISKYFSENRSLILYFCGALSSIVLPIIAISLTYDTDVRRAFAGFILIHIMTSVFVLHKSYLLLRLRCFIIILLTITQVLSMWMQIYNFYPHINTKILPYFYIDNRPPIVGPKDKSPPEQMFEEFTEVRSRPLRIGLVGKFPAGLNIFAKKKHWAIILDFPSIFMSLEEGYEQLLNFEYVLVSSWANPNLSYPGLTPSQIVKKHPIDGLSYDIVERLKNNRLNEVGLSFVKKFSIFASSQLKVDRKNEWLTLNLDERRRGDIHEMVLLKYQDRLEPSENIALAMNGSSSGYITQNKQYLNPGLNDGNDFSAFTTVPIENDLTFYISSSESYKAHIFKLILYTQKDGGGVRDLTVVATNDEDLVNAKWRTIKAKVKVNRVGYSDTVYKEKITIPNAPDYTVATIELDRSDPNWKAYNTWGLACFSNSKGYRINYNDKNTDIYLRQLQIKAP